MEKKTLVIAVAAILAILAIIYIFINNPKIVHDLVLNYGVAGLFVATVIGNATIMFPVPVDILIFLSAQIDFFNLGLLTPLLLGLLLGIASTIGESTSYVVGYYGTESLEQINKREFSMLSEAKKRINKHGGIIIFLGSFTPFPMDIVGLAAGILKYDYKKFFAFCYLGKSIRAIIILYAGYYSISAIRSIFGF
ncbi:MAG: VTT domain-containing protein [archaeon]